MIREAYERDAKLVEARAAGKARLAEANAKGWNPPSDDDSTMAYADGSNKGPERTEPTGRWIVMLSAIDVVNVRADNRVDAVNAVYSMIRDDPAEFIKFVAVERK